MNAAQSVYIGDDGTLTEYEEPEELTFKAEAGDFDLSAALRSHATEFSEDTLSNGDISRSQIKFSTECIKKFGTKNYVELLINPVEMKFAVRLTDASNRNGFSFLRLAEVGQSRGTFLLLLSAIPCSLCSAGIRGVSTA